MIDSYHTLYVNIYDMEAIINEAKYESGEGLSDIYNNIKPNFGETLSLLDEDNTNPTIDTKQDIDEAKKIIEEGGDTAKIKVLTGELAEQLIANYQGEILNLSGLQSIDSETSSFISEFKGKSINLSGLTSLDNDSAFRLGDFQGEELNLSGITELKNEDYRQALWLSNFQGNKIDLSGVKIIGEIAAEYLAKFGGNKGNEGDEGNELKDKNGKQVTLILGITNMSPEIAKKFERFKGELVLNNEGLKEETIEDVIATTTAELSALKQEITNNIA